MMNILPYNDINRTAARTAFSPTLKRKPKHMFDKKTSKIVKNPIDFTKTWAWIFMTISISRNLNAWIMFLSRFGPNNQTNVYYFFKKKISWINLNFQIKQNIKLLSYILYLKLDSLLIHCFLQNFFKKSKLIEP